MKRLSVTLFAILAACSSSGSNSGSDEGGGKKDGASDAPCQAELEEAIVHAALEINDTAQLVETRLVYGTDKTLGVAITARISDDTEPSDYLAVALVEDHTSDPEDDGGAIGDHDLVCRIVFLDMVNTGSVAEDLAEAANRASLPEQSCVTKIQDAVIEKAIGDTKIVAVVPRYGSSTSGTVVNDTMSSAVVVRVTDQIEPKDFLVVVENEGCKLVSIENLAKGELPRLAGSR